MPPAPLSRGIKLDPSSSSCANELSACRSPSFCVVLSIFKIFVLKIGMPVFIELLDWFISHSQREVKNNMTIQDMPLITTPPLFTKEMRKTNRSRKRSDKSVLISGSISSICVSTIRCRFVRLSFCSNFTLTIDEILFVRYDYNTWKYLVKRVRKKWEYDQKVVAHK